MEKSLKHAAEGGRVWTAPHEDAPVSRRQSKVDSISKAVSKVLFGAFTTVALGGIPCFLIALLIAVALK